jgi:hypothetical protein
MAKREAMEVLIAHARETPNWESIKAEAMFRKFMTDGFSYDELSNHPDYPVYASAELLAAILSPIIDEMFARADTDNFLIYHVLSAVDPSGEGKAWAAERAEEVIKLVDKETADKILKLLTTIKNDPPVPVERLESLIAVWRNKAASFSS